MWTSWRVCKRVSLMAQAYLTITSFCKSLKDTWRVSRSVLLARDIFSVKANSDLKPYISADKREHSSLNRTSSYAFKTRFGKQKAYSCPCWVRIVEPPHSPKTQPSFLGTPLHGFGPGQKGSPLFFELLVFGPQCSIIPHHLLGHSHALSNVF